MQLKAFVRDVFSKRKRQKITILSAVFIVYVMLLSGIFAYFHSEDKVSNRLEAKNGSVTIQEPNWDSDGQYKAKAVEPGMTIEKDPSGINNGQIDVFIRLKMTVKADSYTKKNDTYDSAFHYTEAERVSAILAALKLANSTPFLDGTSTNNPDYIMDTATDEDDKTVYYFYYTGGDAEQKMKAVKPNERTTDLFDHLDVPIYKKDYYGVFDQDFDIYLTAEGIPASNYPNGLTFAAAKGENGAFAKQQQ